MAIYDLNDQLNKFYDDHVVLGVDRRKLLAGYRDACLDRLKNGLALLGEDDGNTHNSFLRSIGQGSYSMHTLNQHVRGEYDIDEAVIFAKDDLPAEALEARKHVARALLRAGGNFRTEPEARTNAVTVWYADGAHVDLAIYREVPTFLSSRLEHAGAAWGERDPEAVTTWFKEQVAEKSPNIIADVAKDQLRRVTRWVKRFARSRVSWSLPGGMILTVLAVETYELDRWRDDVSLLRTLKAMQARLALTLDVNSPLDGSSMTSRPAVKAQMKSLLEKLDVALVNLAVLEQEDCTRSQALRAWGKVFNHPFWGDAVEAEGPAEVADKASIVPVEIAVTFGRVDGTGAKPYKSVEMPIPKGRWIRFTLPPAWQSTSEATYRWIVTNTGDEARAAGDMGHERIGEVEEWRQAAYKGVHSMTCEVLRGGVVVARGVRRVQVARW